MEKPITFDVDSDIHYNVTNDLLSIFSLFFLFRYSNDYNNFGASKTWLFIPVDLVTLSPKLLVRVLFFYFLIISIYVSGIGFSLVTAFPSNNHHVFATLRDPSKAGSLSTHTKIEIPTLDVTSATSIFDLQTEITTRTGGTPDVLINNAGADFVIPLLDADLSDARKLYETNVWSILSMTQAFASLLVKARGSICNITSIAAVLPLPYSGIYSSSKAAATQISEVLKLELAPLGVHVTTGMIGAVSTLIQAKSGELNLPESSYYVGAKDVIEAQRKGLTFPRGQTPDVLAKSVVNDILGGKSGKLWRGGIAG